jgi:ankyrin repeat protein
MKKIHKLLFLVSMLSFSSGLSAMEEYMKSLGDVPVRSNEEVARFLASLKEAAGNHVADEAGKCAQAKRQKRQEGLVEKFNGMSIEDFVSSDLFDAIYGNNIDIFKKLFCTDRFTVDGYSKPIEKLLNFRNKHGDTLLHYAIRLERVEFINCILNSVKGERYDDQLCKYSFMKAGHSGSRGLSKKVVKQRVLPLLKKGYWPNGIANEDGYTPYWLARKLLKECGLEKSSAVEQALNDLKEAVFKNIVKILELHEAQFFCTQKSENPDELDSPPAIPLFAACYQGNVRIINLLLRRGANINVVDDDGKNVLSFLSSNDMGYCSVYKLLLEKGIDCNWQDGQGNTPLMNAIFEEDFMLLKELLKRNDLNVGLCNDNGKNAIHAMAQVVLEKASELSDAYELILKKLLKKVMIFNREVLVKKDNWNMTPLHYAVTKGYLQSSALLYKIRKLYKEKLPFMLDMQDGYGYSVLDRAINAGDPSVVGLCLAMGAHPPAEKLGKSKSEDYRQISRMLDICAGLKAGVGINDSDAQGDTMLHKAVKNNEFHVVCLLVRLNADLNKKNLQGKRPVDLVVKNGLACKELLKTLALGHEDVDKFLSMIRNNV